MKDDIFPGDMDYYEARYGADEAPVRQGRRKQSRRTQRADVHALAEPGGLEGGFTPTYQPSRFEEGWLLESLRSFYDDHLISDVLMHIKGGKEASVYCCAAGTGSGPSLLAAKVYRPRQFRNLRNDALYRADRAMLSGSGQAIRPTDRRLMRAINQKTSLGMQITHVSWLMHEYTALERLAQLGAAVPAPVAANENALLMSYIGDEHMAAPTLNGVRLPRQEAERLFLDVLHTITLLLQQGLIHGDLSAYNILYWEGRITLIDLPQVTFSESNQHAYTILLRDVTRVCDYFAQQGVRSQPAAIARDLWARYAAEGATDRSGDSASQSDMLAR